jgi:hypothetical protein
VFAPCTPSLRPLTWRNELSAESERIKRREERRQKDEEERQVCCYCVGVRVCAGPCCSAVLITTATRTLRSPSYLPYTPLQRRKAEEAAKKEKEEEAAAAAAAAKRKREEGDASREVRSVRAWPSLALCLCVCVCPLIEPWLAACSAASCVVAVCAGCGRC